MKADHHHPTAASLLPLCVLRLFCILAAVAAEPPSAATEPPVAAHGQQWGAANGQQWGAVGWPVSWISHPHAAVGEQVWFRRSFTGEGRAVAGQIEMAVSGAAVVYVNGYNVTADAIPLPSVKSSSSISSITHAAGLSPLGEPEGAVGNPSGAMVARHDVTRFLRPDTNVVAVWCAPEIRLSLVFSGLRVTHGGRRAAPFSYMTDATWLCRTCGCTVSADGREHVDGRETEDEWRTGDVEVMKWLNAREVKDGEKYDETAEKYIKAIDEAAGKYGKAVSEAGGDDHIAMEVTPPHRAVRVSRIQECCLTAATAGRLTYSCGRGFRGRIRVTLRGMTRGEVLDIGGMGYICSGESDEQAIMRFTEYAGDSIVISGSMTLTPDKVQNVEAVSFEEYFNRSWMY